jgi:hypothetical protein
VGFFKFIYVRLMVLESTSKFLLGLMLVFETLLFIIDKMGGLSLQEPELREIAGSDTDCFPPAPAQVGLTGEARLRHGSSRSGESEPDPSWGNVDHHEI